MENSRLNDNGTRSTEAAAQNISDRTKLENMFKPIVENDLFARFSTEVHVDDNGCDNSGDLIIDDTKVTGAPDWCVTLYGKKLLVEVLVHSDEFNTCSFKISKLNYAIKHGNQIWVLSETGYLKIDVAACHYLIDSYPVTENPRIYGGKPCVSLDAEQVQALVHDNIIRRVNWHFSVKSDAVKILRTHENKRRQTEKEKNGKKTAVTIEQIKPDDLDTLKLCLGQTLVRIDTDVDGKPVLIFADTSEKENEK